MQYNKERFAYLLFSSQIRVLKEYRLHYRMDIDRLEKVGLEGYNYVDRLRILGLTTLETRY